MGFWDTLDATLVQDTQTDRYSPGNDILMDRVRGMIESIFMLMLDTGVSGTLTSDPPNDTTGKFEDTGAGFSDDEHNGRTLVFTDGAAKGNKYTIDDMVAADDAGYCTDDNLYADGVRSGDAYKILYDLKVNTDGHDHDAINSAEVVLADSQVSQAKLKTNTADYSYAFGTSPAHVTVAAGSYCFWPATKMSSAISKIWTVSICGDGQNSFAGWTSFNTYVAFGSNSGGILYARFRYVQASGEIFWLFILRDKATGEMCTAALPDHPCFNNGGDPDLIPHPFTQCFDPVKHEILVITMTTAEANIIKKKAGNDKAFIEVIEAEYDIDDTVKPLWPDKEVTVGLPDDWEEAWLSRTPVTPIKKKIPKPSMVRTAALKLKVIP